MLYNGRSSNELTVVLSAGENYGGQLVLSDTTETPVILLDAGNDGDASVVLPVDAIAPNEILAEAGIANDIGTNFFTSLTTLQIDYKIDSVTIVIPADGYVELTAGCFVNTDHQEGQPTDVFIGISKTQNIDYFVPGCVVVGISNTRPTGNDRVPAYSTRLYTETAGTHTYYLVAERNLGGSEMTNVANPSIIARFFPTAYGSIASTTFDHTPHLPVLSGITLGGATPFQNPYVQIRSLEDINAALKKELESSKIELERLRLGRHQKNPETQREIIRQNH
jgi:hypothetical protein